MKSFSDCLKKHGLNEHENAILEAKNNQLLGEKYDAYQAAVMAVTAYRDDLAERRSAIYKEIGLEPPAQEPKPTTAGPTTPTPEPAGPSTPPVAPKPGVETPGPSTPVEPPPPKTPPAEPKAPKTPPDEFKVTLPQARKYWTTVIGGMEQEVQTKFKDAEWRTLDGSPHIIAKDGTAFHVIRVDGKLLDVEDYKSPAARRRALGGADTEGTVSPIQGMIDIGDQEGLAKALYAGTEYTPKVDEYPQILPDNLIRMNVATKHQAAVEANMKELGFKITDRAMPLTEDGTIKDGTVNVSALFNPEKKSITDTGHMVGGLKGKAITVPDPKSPAEVQADDILSQLVKSDHLDPQMGVGTFGSFMAREAIFHYVKTATDYIGSKFMGWEYKNAPRKAIIAAIEAGRIKEVESAANLYLEKIQLLSETLKDVGSVRGIIEEMSQRYFVETRDKLNQDGKDLALILDRPTVKGMLQDIRAWFEATENTSDQTNRVIKKDPDVPPKLEAIIRRGLPDWRKGRNVESEQEFKDTFGFRDVEFGNWVDQLQRQVNLNLAYDGLMDLAQTLGVKPSEIGLNKELGLAFGARGRTKAAAHFEPDNNVINLTKHNGNGTVSHEWTHALEHALRNTVDGTRLTDGLREALKMYYDLDRIENIARGILADEHVKPSDRNVPPKQAFLKFLLNGSNVANRIGEMSRFYRDARSMDEGGKPYWAKAAELVARASEAFYFDTLKGGSPYLTGPMVGDGIATKANGYKGTAYPTGKERKEYTNKIIEHFLSQIDWATLDAKTYVPHVSVHDSVDGKFYTFDQYWIPIGKGSYKFIGDARADAKAMNETPSERVLSPDAQIRGQINKKAFEIAQRVDEIMKEMNISQYPEVKNGSMVESMFYHLRSGWWPADAKELREFVAKAYNIEPSAVDALKDFQGEEDFEAAMGKYVGQLVTDWKMEGSNPQEIYKKIVDLYRKQPRRVARTSTSMREQQYSTPLPIAYIASLLGRVTESTTVADLMAGNGLLVFAANPQRVIANEKDEHRALNLKLLEIGRVSQEDAAEVVAKGIVKPTEADTVLLNPPFGPMKMELFDGYQIKRIDQWLALKSLPAMRDDGRAVVILGAQLKPGVITSDDRIFLNYLYGNYNVADHFEIDGKLYDRQGAGWPLRVLVISGRQLSDKLSPDTGTIQRVTTHEELWDRYVQSRPNSEQILVGSVRQPSSAGGPNRQPGAVSGGSGGQTAGTSGTGGPKGGGTAGPRSPGRGKLGGGARSGEPAGAVAGEPGRKPADTVGGPSGGRTSGPGGSEAGGAGTEGPDIGGVLGGVAGLEGVTDTDIDNIFGEPGAAPTPASPGEKKPKGLPKADPYAGYAKKIAGILPQADAVRIDPSNGELVLDDGRVVKFVSFVDNGDTFATIEGVQNPDGTFEPATDATYKVGTGAVPNVKAPKQTPAGPKLDDIFDAVGNILDDPKFSLSEEGIPQEKLAPEISNAKYAAMLPHFETAWNRLAALYREAKAVMVAFRNEFVAKFGDKILPYLKAYVRDKLNKLNDLVRPKERVKEDRVDNALQTVYVPESQGPSDAIFMPAEQAQAMRSALGDLKMRIAEDHPEGIDDFVMHEMGYGSLDEMWHGKVPSGGLAGYQVDALALAIDAMKRGEGFIVGDDTGVGKGRVAAGAIAWSVRQGRMPIFFTAKGDLYSDMRRDLDAIGFNDLEFAVTHGDKDVKNENDELVMRASETRAKSDVEHIATTGTMPRTAKALLTTYSQIQTPSKRRDAIDALVKTGKATLIMDESHSAAGESGRYAYMIRLLSGEGLFGVDSQGAPLASPGDWAAPPTLYLSATFGKRAGNLPIYWQTSLHWAGHSPEDLRTAFQGGGRVLLELVSRMLVNAGQMIRRERSYANIRFNYKVENGTELRDKRVVDASTDVLRSVLRADRAFGEWLQDKQNVAALIRAIAPNFTFPPPGQRQSKLIDHSPFASVIHNYIAQLLLSTKVDAAVRESVAALERGEKPILTMQNTREAALTQYMDYKNVSIGTEVPDYNWGSSLERAMLNTLRVTLRNPAGGRERINVPLSILAQLAPQVRSEYTAAERKIKAYHTDLPASPLDAIRGALSQYDRYVDANGKIQVVKHDQLPKGIKGEPIRVAEFTGRKVTVDYTGTPTIRSRDDPKSLVIRERFNNGEIDVLLLNVAGATGISLHAGEKFADQRPRHMIVLQPNPDITEFKQIIGRINRTGQVEYPLYTVLATAIPAEKRPMAMLKKKMALLSANTSSTNRNATDIDGTTDFINEYGDIVVNAYLREHADIAGYLGLDFTDKDDAVPEDTALKGTGRYAVMPTEDQALFYDQIERTYLDDMAMRDAEGTNRLVRRTLPLNAKAIEENPLVEGDDQSNPFRRDAMLTKYEVDIVGKPPTASHVRDQIKAALNGRTSDQVIVDIEADLKLLYEEASNQKILSINETQQKLKNPKATDKEREDLGHALAHAEEDLKKFGERKEKTLRMLRNYQIGSGGLVRFNDVESFATVIGVNVNKTKAAAGNPYSPSNFVIVFQRNVPGLALPIPMSRLENMDNFRGSGWTRSPDIEHEYRDRAEFTGRTERYIATGNIPVALMQLQGRGEIISFTLQNGSVEDGILMPPSFRPGNLAQIDYGIRSPAHATQFLLSAARAFTEQYIAKNPQWSSSSKEGLEKLKAVQGPNPIVIPVTDQDKPYHMALFSRRRVIAIDPTSEGDFRITINKKDGGRFVRSKQLTDLIGDLGTRRGWDYATTSFGPEKLADVVRWALAQMPMAVLASQKERARLFTQAAGPKLALGWTQAEGQPQFPVGGIARDRIAKFAETLRKQWKNAPPIAVVQRAEDLPFPAPKTVRGAFWNGTVYLVAENLPNNDTIQFVILHETMGHYGLKGILADQLDATMRRIYRTNEIVRKEADRRMAFYRERGRDLSIAGATEEAMADMAAQGRWSQISGWQMLFAQIRNALRKLGFTLKMSNADVAILLANARRYVREGPQQEVAGEAQPKLSLGQMFTMADDGTMGIIKQHVLDRIRFEGKSMSWLNQSINTPYHLAETNKWFRPVYQGVQRFIADVSSFANDAADVAGEDILPRLRNWHDVAFNPFRFSNWTKMAETRRDLREAGKVLWAGTLADLRPTDQQLRDGFEASIRDTHGNEIGTVQAPALTETQIEHYHRMRRTIDLSIDQGIVSEMVKLTIEHGKERQLTSLDEARKLAKDDPVNGANILLGALEQRLEEIEDKKNAGSLTAADAQRLTAATQNTIAVLQEKQEVAEKLKDEGYAPLMRFGQYTVTISENTPDSGGVDKNVLYFGMFETKKDANRMAREMLAEFRTTNPQAELTLGTMDTESWKVMRGLSLDTLEAFAKATGIDENEAVQNYIKMALASRSAMKRLIHRKGIAGYDEDVQRVLATFVTSQARFAARNYHFGELSQAVNDIPVEQGETKGYATRLMEYVQFPNEEAQAIRGFLFVQFVGGSIASALANITQPALTTVPYLSQFEPARGIGGMAKSAGMAIGSVTKALAIVAKGTTDPILREALQLAAKEGWTEPQEIHQLHAESIRSGLAGRSLYARKMMRVWSSAFSLAESFNRKVTFVSAFEMARSVGMDAINAVRREQGREELADAYEFAADAISQTQFIYNKGNRPAISRGSVMATVMTFKQFAISYVEFLSRLPGREKVLALAILGLAAGIEGIPFSDDLMDLWDTIGQALGFSSNAKKSLRANVVKIAGETAGGFLMGGLSGLPGSPVDLSARIGFGNLIPGTSIFKRSTTDATREVAQALGPIGSVLVSARQGLAAAEAGEPKTAFYNVVPKAIRDAMQALDMAQSGFYRDLRGRRVIDTTAADAVFKSIGLMPYDVAHEGKATQGIQQDIALHNVVESSIADRWARGVIDKDPEAVQAAVKDMFAWNLRNPDLRIAIDPKQIRDRVRNAMMTREQRLMRATPKEIRAQEFAK